MRHDVISVIAWSLGAILCSLIIILTRISNTAALLLLPIIFIGTKSNFKSVNRYSLYKKARI